MCELRHVLVSTALAATALGIALSAGPAKAACNEIPLQATWRGFKGTVDTVFGRWDTPSPIPTPDPRNVEVGSSSCNPVDLTHEDYVVVVLFKPPRGGTRNIVALTAQEDCSPVSTEDCQRSDVHCVCGAKANLQVSTALDKLRFRFPDTDPSSPPTAHGQRLTGPATIAVMPYSDPFSLPWSLADQSCQEYGGTGNFFACVDELFDAEDCGTTRSDLDPTFAHFTALPAMNNWQKMCKKSSWPWPFNDPDPKCKNEGPDVLFTVDKAGNVALPVRWAQILGGQLGIPGQKNKNREVEGKTNIPRTKGGANDIRIPAKAFLSSHTPRGAGWPGIVEFNPGSQDGWLVLRGESDEPESVLRISRRELWKHECDGGDNHGQACHQDAPGDCPGKGAQCVERTQASYFACENGTEAGSYCTRSGDCAGGQCTPGSACVKISDQPPPPPPPEPEPPPKSNPPCFTDLDCNLDEECGVGLFEFRSRLEEGVGPVVIPKAKYKAKATKYKKK
jgi:hypothetical protein